MKAVLFICCVLIAACSSKPVRDFHHEQMLREERNKLWEEYQAFRQDTNQIKEQLQLLRSQPMIVSGGFVWKLNKEIDHLYHTGSDTLYVILKKGDKWIFR
jgi:hypothetical protein